MADKNLLDDLARMAGGAVSLLSTIRRQVRADLSSRAQAYSSKMDLAARDEVDRLQASVSKYRAEQDAMKKKINDLEAALQGKSKSPSVKSASKKKPAKPSKRK